jgi:hypothetical protein
LAHYENEWIYEYTTDQWSSTCGTQKHLTEYVTLEKKIVINTEKSGPDLGLATGDPNVRIFDLRAIFLSPSPLF